MNRPLSTETFPKNRRTNHFPRAEPRIIRCSHSKNNPIRYNDPSGHWSEEEIESVLGKYWRKRYFGERKVFEKRDKLLKFLDSKETTDLVTLEIVGDFFNKADNLHKSGIDISSVDAIGERITFSAGSLGTGSISIEMILNLASGQLSGFISPEGGLLLGESTSILGGYALYFNMPSNSDYRGVAKSVGIVGGEFVGIGCEMFSGGEKFTNQSPLPNGVFVGVGGAVPGLGIYGSLSYSIEVLSIDQSGTKWFEHKPTINNVITDLGDVIVNDLLHP